MLTRPLIRSFMYRIPGPRPRGAQETLPIALLETSIQCCFQAGISNQHVYIFEDVYTEFPVSARRSRSSRASLPPEAHPAMLFCTHRALSARVT